MEYKTLTQDEMNLRIAQALRGREEEYFHYKLNQQNYENLLATPAMQAIPATWPVELEGYKKLTRDEAIKVISDPAQLAAVQALQHRDRLKQGMIAEGLEASRVEQYHAQLLDKLPKTKALLDAVLLAEKTEREAAKARG